MISVCNVCKACKKSDLIITDGDCGGTNCGPGNSFKDFVARECDTKTLLDEFAMAAMGQVQISELVVSTPDSFYNTTKICYDYAAAMMHERARRNDDGTLKEEATEK